jgi:hypothetical protein
MSLYNKTYKDIIELLSTAVYNKIKANSASVIEKNTLFNTMSTNYSLKEEWRTQGWRKNTTVKTLPVPQVVLKEYINESYTAPTASKITQDITTYIKNTLGFNDSNLKEYPSGSNILTFVFALNNFLENSLTKTSISPTKSVVIYKPAVSGYKNKIALNFNNITKANMIDNDIIDSMYDTLNTIGDANSSGHKIAVTTKFAGSQNAASSSSSSSSSSSCSSSSSSSSSLFIVYFNLN